MESFVTLREPLNFAQCVRDIRPVADVLAQIGGKWTIFVITALSQGPKRFSELRRELEGISQKMLTATLRDLERDGFVARTVTPSIPPRVDYELTDMGEELRQPLQAISDWAFLNRERVEDARERFAAAEARRKAERW